MWARHEGHQEVKPTTKLKPALWNQMRRALWLVHTYLCVRLRPARFCGRDAVSSPAAALELA